MCNLINIHTYIPSREGIIIERHRALLVVGDDVEES